MLPDKPLLTATDVAKRLSLSATTVRALCDAGELKHFRVGAGKRKEYRISEEALEDYLRRSTGQTSNRAAMPRTRQRSLGAGLDFIRSLGYDG